MARNIENALTESGVALIARSMAESKPIVFTSAAFGTGVAPDADDISEYTALITPWTTAEIQRKYADASGNFTVVVSFWNTGMAAAVQLEEIGLYAKAEGDANPILFSYLTFGQYPSTILPASVQGTQRIFNIPFSFAGGTSATITIDPSTLLSADDASETAEAGKLLYADENGKLPASITGDADTVDGKHASDFALDTHSHSAATTSADGFMSSADKTKLNGIASGANAYTHPNSGIAAGSYSRVKINAQGHATEADGPVPVSEGGTGSTTASGARTSLGITPANIGAAASAHSHSDATASEAGFMSASDKSKLDGVASGANNYTHPNSGATAGTYSRVTVDAKGHVTEGGGAVPVGEGGTGSTSASGARTALGITPANIGAAAASHTHAPADLTSAVPINKGGTGQTTVAAARNALGLGNTNGAVPVANGGTGATTAANARTNLGVPTFSYDSSTQTLTITP